MDNYQPKNQSDKKNRFFYFDAKDERLWVASPSLWIGKALNFANPLAYIVVILGILFLVLLTRLV